LHKQPSELIDYIITAPLIMEGCTAV